MLLILVVGAIALVMLSVPFMYNVIGPRRDRSRLHKNESLFLDHYCTTGSLTRFHQVNRRLPASPRCKLCYVPFGGLGRVLGIRPSRKNSNFCRGCFEASPDGGQETEIGVLFADARGFTAWASDAAPTDVAAALDRFYKCATTSLMAHDAVIDKLVGDEVMAIFISELPSLGIHTSDQMFNAAQELLAGAQQSFAELPIGIGLHRGRAWIGNVGAGDMKDFTALGDVVNVAARLQSCALAGQIVMSPAVYGQLSQPPPCFEAQFTVKGKAHALQAHVVTTTPVAE